jgi:hypothetical protein
MFTDILEVSYMSMNARDLLHQSTIPAKGTGENLGIPRACSHPVGPTHHKSSIFPLLNLNIHNDTTNQAKSSHTLPIQEEHNVVNSGSIMLEHVIETTSGMPFPGMTSVITSIALL